MPKVAKLAATSAKGKPKKLNIEDDDALLAALSDMEDHYKAISMVLFGASGSGKTRLASTFPKPMLYLGAEDGTKSIKKVEREGIQWKRLGHSGELTGYARLAREGNRWKTVVLDTATKYYERILAEILNLEELPPQNSWGMATRDQYGQASLIFRERVRELFELTELHGINTVVIAQERNYNEDNGGDELARDLQLLPQVGPSLSPKIAGWLNAAADYVCSTYIRQKREEKVTKVLGKEKRTLVPTRQPEFCLRTLPHPVYITKFRGDIDLPECIVDPTFEKINKLIGN